MRAGGPLRVCRFAAQSVPGITLEMVNSKFRNFINGVHIDETQLRTMASVIIQDGERDCFEGLSVECLLKRAQVNRNLT